MVILIFGITNVGKTATGEKLAEKLKYSFLDMDQEIKRKFQTTMEEFMRDNPYTYDRSKLKGKILSSLIDKHQDNVVIAVSPIYYARFFNALLDLQQVIGIELQDTEEHIFERLIFSDDMDNIYKDDVYKNLHKDHYIKDIHQEIMYSKRMFKKIEHKYFINNKSVDEVADDLIILIENISGVKQPNE